MMEEQDEQAWVREARAGSAEAFGHLVRRHQQSLRAFLRRLCGNQADADDLAQDSFVTAWNAMERFDPARGFRPWLFGIGWRKYRERRRGWLRLLKRESMAAAQQPVMTDPGPDLRLDMAAALAGLGAEQRAAILLCLAASFTHAEAAEVLALPLGTVKSHVARGREKLQHALGEAP